MALDRVKVRRVAALGIGAWASAPNVAFDTEDSDTANYFTLSAPTRITIPTGKAGKFIFSFTWSIPGAWGSENLGYAQTWINNVGTNYYRTLGLKEDASCLTTGLTLNDGDYVEFLILQTVGGTQNTTARLEVLRVG
jgi:hypothetical protein